MSSVEDQGSQQQPQQPAPASGSGLDPKIGGLLAYLPVLWPIIPIILLVISKDDKYTKFHAAQSIAFGLVVGVLWVVVGIAVGIMTAILSQVSDVLAMFVPLIMAVFGLAVLIAWIMLIVKGYTGYDKGETYKLPVIGNIVEGMVK